ncbi:MAG: hypothetical protein VYC33_00035 [Candidatus Thermoplasmatota archaeon]|nr:hypothetical protein [Candidatus Thermoplasmatota archaeon]
MNDFEIAIGLFGGLALVLSAILLNRQRQSSKKTKSKDPWGSKIPNKQNSEYFYIDQ